MYHAYHITHSTYTVSICLIDFLLLLSSLYLSLMSDDDVLVFIGWRKTPQLILFQSGWSVRSEQPLILDHTQRLAFLPGKSPILRKQLPENNKDIESLIDDRDTQVDVDVVYYSIYKMVDVLSTSRATYYAVTTRLLATHQTDRSGHSVASRSPTTITQLLIRLIDTSIFIRGAVLSLGVCVCVC